MNSKARSGFRKLALVLGVLLLLFVVIGHERWFARDERSSQRGTPGQVQDQPRPARAKPTRVESRSSVDPAPAAPDAPAEDLPELSLEEKPALESRRNVSGGPPARLSSQIYFIRGYSLLTSRVEGQSRASAIEMLEEAVSRVTATLPEGNLVFDSEGLAASRGRFVVYAKPGYDITEEVAVVFDQLKLQQRRQSAANHPGK